MASRGGTFLLGAAAGYGVYFYTNRQLHARTSEIERLLATIGYNVYVMRAATGVSEAAGGVIMPKQVAQPLHPRPPIPPESDAYYDALYSSLVHKWNGFVRTTHRTVMGLLMQQQQQAEAAKTTDAPQQQ